MLTYYGTRLSENMAETPEGYLICYDVNIARIGTQDYLGSELGISDDVVKVNRPAEEVFKPATVASFEGKPFTNDHPYELLDANNTSIYSKGHLQNVRVSDDKTYLVGDIIVTDSQAVQDIKNGKREISAGYNCDCLQDDNGNWYQANIIGNHVALVDKGRAGDKVRINDAEWNESDHPRAKNGQFGKGSGGSAPKQEESESGENEQKQSKYNNSAEAQREIRKQGEMKRNLTEASQQVKEAKEHNTEKLINRLNSEHFGKWVHVDEPYKLSNLEGEIDNVVRRAYKNYNGNTPPIESIYNGIQTLLGRTSVFSQERNSADYKNKLKKVENKINQVMKEAEGYNKFNNGKWTKDEFTKEKSMKDSKTLLGRMFKAFAQDAEPDEIVEALKEVKGEDEEPDRIGKLEAMVQDLCARMDAYDEAHKPAEEPTTALDEMEKELVDEEPEKEEEKKEVEDEDANNDPKLIEAISEKAQEDEDTTEEIKKEIADAKKVVARIEDKEVRMAVADSLATIIRGKMKSSENYKKLMDASKKKPEVNDSKCIDYNAVFKKIKEEKFRK